MINENNIRQELRKLTESEDIIGESDFDMKSYIERRLKQYSDAKQNDFSDLKSYFANNTDIEQPTNAQEEEEAYMKLIHNFLSSEGF